MQAYQQQRKVLLEEEQFLQMNYEKMKNNYKYKMKYLCDKIKQLNS